MAEEIKDPAAPEGVAAAVEKPASPPSKGEDPAPEPTAEMPVPAGAEVISQQASFKEETYVVGELPEPQRKALDDLKKLIQDAFDNHEFSPLPPKEEEKKTEETPAPAADEKTAYVPPEELPKTAPVSEPAKVEAEAEKKPVVEEKKLEEASTATAPEKVVEKVATVATTTDKDGEKTVEAIEESVVSVAVDPAQATAETPAAPPPAPEEVFIWGIPLLGDERSDVVLLKFLRARDFKVKDSFAMIKKCVMWRKEFGVDSLLEEDLGNDYEKVVFSHGCDKEGRPVVYNVFGEFKNRELYQLAFSDAEKQKKFLKWLVQLLEKTIRSLDFTPTGVSSLVLVNDLNNSPGYGKRDFYKIINKFFALLQDNYPEFVAKQACLNVSWWYLAYSWVYISVFTPRSKSKFVFANSSRAADTLFRYVAPEQVPVQFGGHSRAGELEFTSVDAVTEVSIKPSSKHTVELSLNEPCVLVWELRVVGWECTYEAQFVPAEGYTVLVSKPRKMNPTDEPIICDSFKIGESGKVVLIIDNHTSRKKKLLYRSKIKASE